MSTSSGFFTDGAAYERLMGRWSRRAGDIFLDWLDAPKNLRWIDVGCGTGVFTEELIARCAPASVIGIDPSSDQIDYAATRPGLKGIEFRVADGQNLPFPDASFDAAVMALVIHFVPDPARGVAELARVLKAGGVGCAYVWDYTQRGGPTAPPIAAMKSIGIDSIPPPSREATSLTALENLWRGAGFGEVETRPIRIKVEFSGFDDFWESMTMPVGPMGKVIAEMSPETRDRFRAALREQVPPGADGRVAYDAIANAVKGRKAG